MTTARAICERALQVCGVTGLNRTPSNRQISAALDHLNEMMHGLNTRGAVIEWADKVLSDTMPWPAEQDDLVIHALANRLRTPTGSTGLDAALLRRMEGAEVRLAGRYTPMHDDPGYF